MINFTQSMALELSDDAIRVNTVSPDHTITPGGRGNRSGPVDPSTWVQRSPDAQDAMRSEEHTSELQSLMRISYAVFCLNKQTIQHQNTLSYHTTRLIYPHNV